MNETTRTASSPVLGGVVGTGVGTIAAGVAGLLCQAVPVVCELFPQDLLIGLFVGVFTAVRKLVMDRLH